MRLPRRFAPAALALATLPLGLAATASAHVSPSPLHTIPFSSATVDPARSWDTGDPGAGNLVLVQFERFGVPGLVARVAATGAVLVQPLAPVSYLVWADRAQAAALRDLPGVRWAGVLPPEARVGRSVTARTNQLRVTLVDVGAASSVGGADVSPRPFTEVEGAVTVVAGDARRAAQLSRLPAVYSVADAGGVPQLRDEKGAQVVAQGTAQPLAPGYRAFLGRIGADGTGVVVSHVDGGVDLRHPELAGRIAACVDYSTPGGAACTAGNTDDVVGHGTHTLGVVLGTGSTGLGDGDGFDYGLGVAPGSTAVVQNAINVAASRVGRPFASGYRPLYRDAWRLGAIVSQNAWGPKGTPQGYDETTREFDSLVRDVDDGAPGDQQLALVFSVMNGRGRTSTQGSPDEAKNIIGVGGTGARKATASSSPTVDDLCTCTAHGPALDGRLLPTLVAPAQNVMSTRATQATLCGAVGAASDIPPSPLHASCTGTSFASPHVSGGYAVFVDWYRERFGATPSPALVKAAFVNGADDLAGHRDANGRTMTAIPNNQQGWGRFNLGNVIDGWAAGEVHIDQSVALATSGQSWSTQVEPVDPGRPMKVSLVWTDALGPGLGGQVPAWVNDLDLTVTTGGGEAYLGNVFEDGMSALGGEADRRNNIENVYLAAPAGVHTVRVTAANLLGDGLPNREGPTDQDFALVVTNARPVGTAQEASRPGG